MTVFQDSCHLGGVVRQNDGQRQTTIRDERVRFEGNKFARLMHKAIGREQIRQIRDDGGTASQHLFARLKKRNHIRQDCLPHLVNIAFLSLSCRRIKLEPLPKQTYLKPDACNGGDRLRLVQLIAPKICF